MYVPPSSLYDPLHICLCKGGSLEQQGKVAGFRERITKAISEIEVCRMTSLEQVKTPNAFIALACFRHYRGFRKPDLILPLVSLNFYLIQESFDGGF